MSTSITTGTTGTAGTTGTGTTSTEHVDDDALRAALAARDLIAEAKAVVMERHGLAPDEAFEWLRHYSRTCDRPLRDVALKVVHGTWVADV